jgi:hypothetical protein
MRVFVSGVRVLLEAAMPTMVAGALAERPQ